MKCPGKHLCKLRIIPFCFDQVLIVGKLGKITFEVLIKFIQILRIVNASQKMLVNLEEIFDKVLQFFFHELFHKVVNFLTLIFTRFFDFLFSIILRFNKKKKDQETFQTLYQSSNFLIVNKKHDVLLNSNDKSKNTVTSQLKTLFSDILAPEITEFFFAHRLDFATSGILCIPLNRKAFQELWDNLEQQKSSKFYFLAVVSGHLDCETEIIDINIGEDTRFKDTSKKMCSSREKMYCKTPRRSITKFLVLEKGYYNDRWDKTYCLGMNIS